MFKYTLSSDAYSLVSTNATVTINIARNIFPHPAETVVQVPLGSTLVPFTLPARDVDDVASSLTITLAQLPWYGHLVDRVLDPIPQVPVQLADGVNETLHLEMPVSPSSVVNGHRLPDTEDGRASVQLNTTVGYQAIDPQGAATELTLDFMFELCGRGFGLGIASGAPACITCQPGEVAATPSIAPCSACGPGRVQPAEGQTSCEACAPGTVQSNEGRASCGVCAAGKYQPSSGATACGVCEAGH